MINDCAKIVDKILDNFDKMLKTKNHKDKFTINNLKCCTNCKYCKIELCEEYNNFYVHCFKNDNTEYLVSPNDECEEWKWVGKRD